MDGKFCVERVKGHVMSLLIWTSSGLQQSIWSPLATHYIVTNKGNEGKIPAKPPPPTSVIEGNAACWDRAGIEGGDSDERRHM
jgi:hypothetical protein